MKIKALHQYAKDVDTVFGLFHDPDFMKIKYEGIRGAQCRGAGMRRGARAAIPSRSSGKFQPTYRRC